MEAQFGYLLTSKVEDNGDQHHIYLYGVNDQGPFVLLFTNERPLFFVEKGSPLPTFPFEVEKKSVPLKSFKKHDVEALYFKSQKHLFMAKDLLQTAGIKTFEADVRSYERLLMERFIHCSLAFKGEREKIEEEKEGSLPLYINPQMTRADYRPIFSVLSLDIETGRNGELYSVAFHLVKGKREIKRVIMAGGSGERRGNLTLYPTERELLEAFLILFNQLDPDIILGWHVIGFDFLFLENKFKEHQIPFLIGRGGTPLFLQEKQSIGYVANLDGRIIIDGPPTMRSANYRFENFRLETVAQEILGTGKDISTHDSESKINEIEHRFRHDKEALARYNLMDCELVSQIFAKTGLLELLIKRSLITGMFLDQLHLSSKSFDHFYLPRLHRKGYVAGNVTDLQRDSSAEGGYVLDPLPGLHRDVIVLDFKSLYPSIIRTFKIDPLGLALSSHSPLQNPANIPFSLEEHILPSYIEELLQKRGEARKDGDQLLSESIKLLMNSCYGVMGTSHSRFYHADLPMAVTRIGQWVLKFAVEIISKLGYQVIYGDTDSLFIKLKEGERFEIEKKALFLAEAVNQSLKEEIQKNYKALSFLELQYRQYFRKFFNPTLRESSEEGAKKKYVGLLTVNGKEEIYFAGMEFVRSDWTSLAKKFQYEMFRRFFAEEEIHNWIRHFVEDLKGHSYDGDLVYRKRLTKKADEYTKSIPHHVKAALMLGEEVSKKLREIEYIMTYQGPVPIQLNPRNIDYEHYIDKQLRPLADMVLGVEGKSFDEVIMGQQLSLF